MDERTVPLAKDLIVFGMPDYFKKAHREFDDVLDYTLENCNQVELINFAKANVNQVVKQS